ncbi:acyl carrier protein [Streptococcus mutans]|nr:phosphopantetheine-binding protein [Streptococcus mutans]MCB4979144.1 phosphopantetheine-binding protein [Streptococcus mutans]MCB5052358.1 phosphopantetheine-binding protein [Streptococcus mutans]MCB5063532.1 phosphopantetheine-binding protein [Streptococcus mutans]MDB8631214.1 phosphopantetheine-binding protein [Streptococcus mutans]MDP5872488.1 phosphopantetheine-binding protein [Streptococcus mutans]
MTKEEIIKTIKEKVLIERLELEDIEPEEIDDAAPLFGEGLGLDSVEALDVVVGVEEEFGVQVPKQMGEEMQEKFYSVNSLADFIYLLQE